MMIIPNKSAKKFTKNLFDLASFDANKVVGGGTMWSYIVQLKPNTYYTVSTNAPYTPINSLANVYAGGVNTGNNGVKDGSPRTILTGTGGTITLYVRNQSTSSETSDAYDKLISGIYWIQIEEGNTSTSFEPYKVANKVSKGIPVKNYVPNFNDSGWFQDATALGGTVVVDPINPHKMTLTITAGAQGRLIWIPVKVGQTYTLSFTKSTGLYRAYSGKVRFHDDNKWLNKAAGNASITFTVDASYGGYVTLRFTAGSAGYYTFENFQLEEGSVATSFEPYKERSKSALLVPKKNLLNPKAWVSGRIFDTAFKSQNGYRLNGDNLVIMSDINGMVSQVVDVKPNTLYTVFHGSDNDGSRGIYVYSMLGTDITPSVKISPNVFNSGNNTKVIIGMYKSTSANNLPEIEIVKPMMVEGSVKVDFEPFKLTNRSDKLVPKRNMIPPLRYWSKTDGNAAILSDYEGEINPVSNYTGFKYSTSLGIQRDTTYTISIDEITVGAVFFIAYLDNTGTNRYTTVNSDSLVKTFSIPASAQYYWLEMHFQTSRGKARFKNFMIQEGTIQRPFEPLEMIKEEKEILRKAPYRNYPFNFQRESVEVLDGIQYRINNPRIKDNGLLIEEGVTNTVSNSDQVNRLRVLNNAYGQVTYNHAMPKRSVVQSGANKYTLQFEIKMQGTSTIPFRSIVVGSKPTGDSWSWRLYYYDFGSKEIEDLGNGWLRYKKTFTIDGSKGEYLQSFIKFICEVYDTDIDTLIRNVQVEERTSRTSYTTGYRKNEIVTVPNTTGFVESAGGSIYSKFSYLDLNYTMSNSSFLFDTTNPARWFCNYDSVLGKFQVVVNGLSLIQFPKEVLKEKDNELLIEWKGSTMTVTLNGVVQTSTAGSGSAKTDIGMLVLGSRFTRDMAWMNGIIKSFVIKDRNGNITFQI